MGVARKDGENGARAMLEYLQSQPSLVDPSSVLEEFKMRLNKLNKPIVQKPDLKKLAEAQEIEAEKSGMLAYKYATNDEMLETMGFKRPVRE